MPVIVNIEFSMKIIIKAKPGAKEDKIERIDESNYIVYVKAPPIDGKANAAIIKLLADHFDVSQSLVEIISGHMARVKVVEINN
ncbi:MAG: DUF167 domain-containing protein [Bacteriovoracales bacterium]